MKNFYVDFDVKYRTEAEAFLKHHFSISDSYHWCEVGADKCRVSFEDFVSLAQCVDFMGKMAIIQGRQWLIYQQLKAYRGDLTRLELGRVQAQMFDVYWENEERMKEAVRWDLKKIERIWQGIDIGGYLYFAAPCLHSVVKLMTAAEVDKYLDEKEQEEFVQVLKFFVEIQEPLVDETHLILNSDQFELFDPSGQDLKKDYLASLSEAEEISNISQEDLVMSLLMTLMPAKIIVHFGRGKNESLLKMVETVFKGRLRICTGCHWCSAADCLN